MKKATFLICILTILIIFHGTAQTTGYFGGDQVAAGYPSASNTYGMWIKFGELTLNGSYNAAGVVIEFFPRNSNHGDSRHTVIVEFRNSSSDLESTYDVVLLSDYGYNKSIKDVKAVRTSGNGVTNNKLSIWIQMSVSWLQSVPIEVRSFGSTTFNTTNQPYYTSITETGTTYGLTAYKSYTGSVFEVSGTIRSKEVKVEATSWPDYVFSPSYELNELNEVESFILQNHHLPEIPSESEITENGVDLGNTIGLLLKKIEELTLYTIEQQKQLDMQAKELEKLKLRLTDK